MDELSNLQTVPCMFSQYENNQFETVSLVYYKEINDSKRAKEEKKLLHTKIDGNTFPNFSGVNSWNLGTILPPAFTNRSSHNSQA